ncbi:hypothetical protein C1645_277263 [Glomus cerebriforme]|uniref:Uncharacterized protein n=1 Tax=Glomus cerebriforme TaxID=658196 RepID=A0A397TWJ0_9GLOM|nr:hypothetical protein C1645_277263 [Glomus cerebriforme]
MCMSQQIILLVDLLCNHYSSSMKRIPDNDNNLFEKFLEDDDNDFEGELGEAFLEQLISQEGPRLLNAEVDNSILMQQLFDIQGNKQQSNIFHAKSFIQAHETVQNEEINKCSSESDDEIEENVDDEQELENKSELYENETHIIDETSSIPFRHM